MIKRYKFGFELGGLLLFLIIMVPNFIWFVVPAPNDILRADSVTPMIDIAGSVFQVLFVVLLCVLKRDDVDKLKCSRFLFITIMAVGLYFAGWAAYYLGITNPIIIILLTLPPCIAFIFYSLDRKNILALVPVIGFTCCHLIYGLVNFIM